MCGSVIVMSRQRQTMSYQCIRVTRNAALVFKTSGFYSREGVYMRTLLTFPRGSRRSGPHRTGYHGNGTNLRLFAFKTMCFIVFPSFRACRNGKINVFFRVFIIKKIEIDQKPLVFSAKVVREPSKFRRFLVFYGTLA